MKFKNVGITWPATCEIDNKAKHKPSNRVCVCVCVCVCVVCVCVCVCVCVFCPLHASRKTVIRFMFDNCGK